MRKLVLLLFVVIFPAMVFARDGKVEFRTVALEIGGKYPAEGFSVIRNRQDWERVWNVCLGNNKEDGEFVAPPQVDFSREMLVAVFGGRQPAVVHSIQIKNITFKDNEVIVEVEKEGPEDFIGKPMLNSPYHIVAISKGLTGAKFIVKGIPGEIMPQEITLSSIE